MSRKHTKHTKHSWRWGIIAAALPLALLLVPRTAIAASCLDDVQQLAADHGLSTRPPTASPQDKAGPRVTTNQLAHSGGVIQPPAAADNAVIKPPAGQDPGMSTVPDVKPKPGSPNASGAPAMPDTKAGADRATLQAALVAARADAERGSEQGCREQLDKARQILSKGKP
jgi:hypothetical protein